MGALNNSHYVDVKFDDPGLNPTTEEPGFQFPQGEDAGITVHVDESVLVKVDDQFSGGDDDDYNDLIIDVRGSEHGLFHGGDGNDTAYGNEGNDTLHGHDARKREASSWWPAQGAGPPGPVRPGHRRAGQAGAR
ncbi:hypothetical protein [Salidesulfovibrio onnuriiensis]|uniref:hypothetical protein n=1 Tax=Salidesulfovibrio onnuriiensis TaxID=2583823 RepID=UPI0011C9AE7A|nr:hypothetical protein [Salidesulfovibrio onnuriiensis]